MMKAYMIKAGVYDEGINLWDFYVLVDDLHAAIVWYRMFIESTNYWHPMTIQDQKLYTALKDYSKRIYKKHLPKEAIETLKTFLEGEDDDE